MANSKYQYVKKCEAVDEHMAPNIIVVRIGGRNFEKFSKVHEFAKPSDEQALRLMNECAKAVLEEKGFHEIACAYGFLDEYSFVFKKDTKLYKRRGRFFGHILPGDRTTVMIKTCFSELIRDKKSDREANGVLKETRKQQKHDLLFNEFKINYKERPEIARQGSFLLRQEVEEIMKYGINGTPVKRKRIKVNPVHSKNVTSRSFWSAHPYLLEELGKFEGDICNVKPEYIRSFQFENKLLPSTWIVIRIDGCHFHKFSEVHDFEKPNDTRALNLMNSCAMAVVEEFNDIVFAYGVSDDYSFVLKKDSEFYGRRPSEIVSVITSFFTSAYVMKWKELKLSPYFDGRAICYPSDKILLDYMAWRQVDCHINNLYNTCFWVLVKSGEYLNGTQIQEKKPGMTKTEAHKYLKGTRSREKIGLLKRFGIDYKKLPQMFRLGSSVFWDKEERTTSEMNGVPGMSGKKVVVDYINIIDKRFWREHPHILMD